MTNVSSKQPSFHILLFCLLMLISVSAIGQKTYEREISLSTWIEEMQKSKEEQLVYKNVFIYAASKAEDSLYFQRWRNSEDTIRISSSIKMFDCDFSNQGDIVFARVEFNGFLTFRKCRFANEVIFEKCLFNGPVQFRQCKFDEELILIECTINKNFHMLESTALGSDNFNCEFNGGLVYEYNKITRLQFIETNFNITADRKSIQYLLWSGEFDDIHIWRCNIKFEPEALKDSLEFYKWPEFGISVSTNALQLFHDTFEVPISFYGLDASSEFSVGFTVFDSYVDCEAINFSSTNTNFDWKLLKNRLKISNSTYGDSLNFFDANEDFELQNTYGVKELLATYKKFHGMYVQRGDMQSANACFIEMKDIETRWKKYLMDTDGSVDNITQYYLNLFLKTFCDYGTNPIKSLIISLYVVFGFACFYFFFYSEWDRINRSFFIAKSKKLLTYFQSEQKMEDFYTDEHKDEMDSYQSFKSQIRASAGTIPFYMRYLMKPLYRLSLIRYKVISWLYRRTEILSGKWEDLAGSRKLVVGSVVGVSLTFYLVYLVLVRSLNSLFLSINTFSTLGFGDIPVKGISRYVAILEGFLGWFLLSIFSVSLISQILQN